MAHRIYLYNYDQETNQYFDTYLGEWNYEIPLLLYPLVAEDSRLEGTEFLSNKEQGIVQLRYFFNLLADTYQLHYKKAYYEPVNNMFAFLEALPYGSFILNATDVFNMREERHEDQAKEWLLDIQQKSKLYKKAIKTQNLSVLDPLFSPYGYSSFLEILQTDWIKYGLGYFEELAYKKIASSIFEEDGKFGLKNSKGTILAPAIYDRIFEADYHYGISVVERDGLFGYLKSSGHELVPPMYESACEVFDVEENEPLGEVKLKGKIGILKLFSDTWALIPDYDSAEVIQYGFICVEIDKKYGVSNLDTVIIPIESDYPYAYDYFPELFFTKRKGTNKCGYFTKEGNYLGDYAEDSLLKAGACYWVKPNKVDKKGRLIDNYGKIIADEIDQFMNIEKFDTVAICKAKSWQLYHTVKKKFLLEETAILKVKAEPSDYRKKDMFIISTAIGTGVYDADEENWLVGEDSEIKQINYIENNFLSIHKTDGYQVFDFENGLSAEMYDYVSNPLNYRTEEGLLFLYKDRKMWRMNEDKSIHVVAISEYGAIYLDRYSFRGKDLTYFTSFYEQWKKNAGISPEKNMDINTLKKMAIAAKEEENYTEALRLFELAAEKNDVDSWVEIGLLLTDPDIQSLFEPKKGIGYYEKAAKQNHPVAWNNMGALYQNGIGYSFNIKKAIKAYEKAADLGDGQAMENLGDLYYYGQHVKQQHRKALDFYQKAEKKYFYNYGKISEIYYQLRDYENLLIYLKKDDYQSYSCIYYAILYDHGMGVKADVKKAIKFYEQANEHAPYAYATERLLYYYGEDLTYKNKNKYQQCYNFAKKNDFEIED